MPAGCDFICKNENCKQYKTGFSILGPWAMSKIELVISSLTKTLISKPLNQSVIDKLILDKNNGRKYACITYPDESNMEKSAYLVQLWSPEAKTIWNHDVEYDGISVESSIIAAKLPTLCPKTNCKLLSFEEVIKDENGIICPCCGQKLTQLRWFTGEKQKS